MAEDMTQNAFIVDFTDALDDDFNSAGAFAVVHDAVRQGNRALDAAQRNDEFARGELIGIAGAFVEMTTVLGFDFPSAVQDDELVGGLVEYLIELRQQAREEKAFERGDAIRDRLTELGVAIEDTPTGTRWRIGG
jgi:cysteinyl-tRNA synthetase